MNQENIPNKLPAQGNKSEEEIDLLDLIGILYKHKFLVIGITGFAIIYILIYSIISLKLPAEKSFMPNYYTPISLVKINEEDSSSGLSNMLDSSSGLGSLVSLAGGSSGGATSSALAKKLGTSNRLIDTLGDEFNLDEIYGTKDSEYPLTSLRSLVRGKLLFEYDETTGTMEIGYTDIDKVLATSLTRRIVELLEAEFTRIDEVSNKSQKELLKKKIADVELGIANLENEYKVFKSSYGVFDASVMAESFSSKIMSIKTSMIDLDAEISSLNSRAGRDNPIMADRYRAKKALEESLRILEDEGAYGLPSMEELSEYLVEDTKLSQEIEIQRLIYTGLLQQYEMLKLTEKGTSPTFQIIEDAEIPEMKSGPSRAKLCMVVAVSSFFLSILFAFMLEFWLRLKSDPIKIKKLRGEI